MTGVLTVLAVAIGGALGALARWGIASWSARRDQRREEPGMPWPTFAANVLACFLVGLVTARLDDSASALPAILLMVLVMSLAGGLSTMSTFALESITLVRRGASVIALGYALLSAGVGMIALWLGLVIAS